MGSLKVGKGRAAALAELFGASKTYVDQAVALLQDAPGGSGGRQAASLLAGRCLRAWRGQVSDASFHRVNPAGLAFPIAKPAEPVKLSEHPAPARLPLLAR
jgi:hypothetical protein